MSDVVALTHNLISRPSVTPEDAGCQDLVEKRLAASGFEIERLDFGNVRNLVAWHGEGSPRLVFLGHTDVVPPGPETRWSSPPFKPTEREGRLYGRGTADMKGAVAAMVIALEHFVVQNPNHDGTVGLMLTSDEEGPAEDGIRKVVPALQERGIDIDFCVVGEPSSLETLGDNIRIGRRGSLNIEIAVNGIQGHAAFPHLADNPIHRALAPLAELANREWDTGTDHFPPTSFQITHVAAGSDVFNVIPGEVRALCNFRYNPRFEPETLIEAVRGVLDAAGVDYTLSHQDSGRPFLTDPGPLIDAVVDACQLVCSTVPNKDTGGGTSDGRFVAPTGAAVVEIGPVNSSIHKIDEWVSIDALDKLMAIYKNIAESLLTDR